MDDTIYIWVWAIKCSARRNPVWKVSLGGRPDGRPTIQIISNNWWTFIKKWIGRPAGRAAGFANFDLAWAGPPGRTARTQKCLIRSLNPNKYRQSKWGMPSIKSNFSHRRKNQRPRKATFHTDVIHALRCLFVHFDMLLYKTSTTPLILQNSTI